MPLDAMFTSKWKKTVHHEYDEAYEQFKALPVDEQRCKMELWWQAKTKGHRIPAVEYACFRRERVNRAAKTRVSRYARQLFWNGADLRGIPRVTASFDSCGWLTSKPRGTR